jgi:hypothetical protein
MFSRGLMDIYLCITFLWEVRRCLWCRTRINTLHVYVSPPPRPFPARNRDRLEHTRFRLGLVFGGYLVWILSRIDHRFGSSVVLLRTPKGMSKEFFETPWDKFLPISNSYLWFPNVSWQKLNNNLPVRLKMEIVQVLMMFLSRFTGIVQSV